MTQMLYKTAEYLDITNLEHPATSNVFKINFVDNLLFLVFKNNFCMSTTIIIISLFIQMFFVLKIL